MTVKTEVLEKLSDSLTAALRAEFANTDSNLKFAEKAPSVAKLKSIRSSLKMAIQFVNGAAAVAGDIGNSEEASFAAAELSEALFWIDKAAKEAKSSGKKLIAELGKIEDRLTAIENR